MSRSKAGTPVPKLRMWCRRCRTRTHTCTHTYTHTHTHTHTILYVRTRACDELLGCADAVELRLRVLEHEGVVAHLQARGRGGEAVRVQEEGRAGGWGQGKPGACACVCMCVVVRVSKPLGPCAGHDSRSRAATPSAPSHPPHHPTRCRHIHSLESAPTLRSCMSRFMAFFHELDAALEPEPSAAPLPPAPSSPSAGLATTWRRAQRGRVSSKPGVRRGLKEMEASTHEHRHQSHSAVTL